jgi:hypothetical protein
MWRLMGIDHPRHLHPMVDDKKCYVFRNENRGAEFLYYIIAVERFWGPGEPSMSLGVRRG